MTLTPGNITLDCDDVERIARFWSEALGRPQDPADPQAEGHMRSIPADEHTGLSWLFLKVPESKTAKNRLHLDLVCDDPRAEIERLLDIGARHLADKREWGFSWSVLADPEGNEFCIIDPGHGG